MPRKHNTKHNRSKSHYPDRLTARGESPSTVRMADPKLNDGKLASTSR